MMLAIVFLSLLVSVSSLCDNQCSGHGICGKNSVCTCYDNWGVGLSHDSGDCSERICPYEFAWVDTPDENGYHHKYTECASRGICDRDTGTCECFAGYEGKACQRTSCPNQCSGHGTCEYIENLGVPVSMDSGIPSTYLNDERPVTKAYHHWDKTRTRGCVCDPEWADVDCSKRMCPYGNDVMDHRLNMVESQSYHTQKIQFNTVWTPATADGASAQGFDDPKTKGKTFALSFTSKLNETYTTRPIEFDVTDATEQKTFTDNIERALEELPGGVIDSVQVTATRGPRDPGGYERLDVWVKFVGPNNQGRQNLLQVRSYECLDGCTPYITGLTLSPVNNATLSGNSSDTHSVTEVSAADFNSYECGRRGKCDYDSGVCECFEGYTGLACNTITALV